MYLFFDTETTGLPKDWKAPVTQLDNWPRVIQLAFAVFDEKESCILQYCELIKPDGWVMPSDKFWTDHGYSQEASMEKGKLIESALMHFSTALNSCEFLIAHNMSFDEKVLGAEFIRAGINSEKKPKKICTKEVSTNFCALPNQNGYASFKWPKLEELHMKLFNANFDGAHDALNDVMACAKCFFELKKLNVIK